MAQRAKRRKRTKRGPGNVMSGVRIFYRKCLKIRGDLERAAEEAHCRAMGCAGRPLVRLEEPIAIAIYKDVPTFFAIAEKESAGWYKRPMWADARYGAK